MKRLLKLKLNDSLQIIEAVIIDINTGKLIRPTKLNKGLKELIKSKYIEYDTYKNT